MSYYPDLRKIAATMVRVPEHQQPAQRKAYVVKRVMKAEHIQSCRRAFDRSEVRTAGELQEITKLGELTVRKFLALYAEKCGGKRFMGKPRTLWRLKADA